MSNPLPEPFLQHELLADRSEIPSTSPPRVGTRRLGFGLLVLGLCWVLANNMATTTLLAAKIDILDPADKVFLLGLATAIFGVTTTIALFAWGVVSDQTRSRFGRRIPWIAFGAAAGAVGLVLMGASNSIVTLLCAFIVYGIVFSALPASILATFPDRVPQRKRGTLSAIYGGASVFGGSIGGILASRFLTAPDPLFYFAAAVLVVGGLIFVLVAPDHSNKTEPRARLDVKGLVEALRFPAKAPDFYWAFAGRFLLLLGLYMVQNFILYILTDYIGLSTKGAGNVIAIGGILSLVTIVVGTAIAGPVSDRLKRRKAPILAASLLFAVGVLIPVLFPTALSIILYVTISGLGLGAFLSVDAALLTEVLPSHASRGRDLGILNTASTVPQIVAPLATAGIVGAGFGYMPVFIASFVAVVAGAFSILKIKSVR